MADYRGGWRGKSDIQYSITCYYERLLCRIGSRLRGIRVDITRFTLPFLRNCRLLTEVILM